MPMVGYIRVSDVGGREGDRYGSPELQEKPIRGWAEQGDVPLLLIEKDEDVSGAKRPEDRALEGLIQMCERGEADGIIVSNVDRLSRGSLLEQAEIYERLDRCGARLVAVNEGIDTANPGAELTLNLMAVVARANWRRYQANYAQSRERGVGRGAYPARTPYGYNREESGVIVPNPETAPVVRLIFSLSADRMGLSVIARQLEAQEIRSPKGGPRWSYSTLRQILKNRVYLGEARHGSYENLTAHEPVVTPAEFAAAQHAKTRQAGDPRAHSANALAKGLARCAGCGHTLKVLPPNWKGVPHYYCKGPYAAGGCPARCHVTDIAILDRYIERWFLAEIKDVAPVAQAEEASEKAAEALQALEAAQAELDAFLEHAAALGNADYATAYEKKKAARDLAQLLYAEAQQEVKTFEAYPSGDLLARWPTLTVEHRRQLIGSVVDRINVSKAPPDVPIADRVQFVRGDVVLEVPEEVRVLAAKHP